MSTSPRTRTTSGALLVACVLLGAINLRPAITSVGPVLPLVAADTGLGASLIGLLSAVPIIMFAVVSPGVHVLAERFGLDRTIAGALAVLAVGTAVRSWPGPVGNLWVGMAIVGATIAVLNVAVPVVVRRDFPLQAARVTGLYVAALSVMAALASGLAVPLAAATELGWRLGVGVWAVLPLVALVVWLPLAARNDPAPSGHVADGDDAPVAAGAPVWRSGLAWQLAAYMGLQSTGFYVLLTWLPTVEHDVGVSPAVAGWHLFLMQVAGIVANLAAPILMRVGTDQRLGAVVPGALLAVGALGLLTLPGLIPLWVVLVGMGAGGAFVVALSLISLRAADARTAARLSAMSQAFGYALTALGLVAAGVVRDVVGDGPAVLVLVALAGVGVVATGMLVGRDRVLRAR